MKKIYFLLFMLTVCVASAQKPDPNFTDKIALQDAQSFLKLARFIEAEGNADTDLTYQRLNFTVDPAVNKISGSVFSQVKFRKDNVSVLRFDLNSVLIVDSIQYNLKKIAFEHLSNKINITGAACVAVGLRGLGRWGGRAQCVHRGRPQAEHLPLSPRRAAGVHRRAGFCARWAGR